MGKWIECSEVEYYDAISKVVGIQSLDQGSETWNKDYEWSYYDSREIPIARSQTATTGFEVYERDAADEVSEDLAEGRSPKQSKLFEFHADLCADALKLMHRKNNDYAGESGESPFKNFLHSETLGLCSVEQGIVVRLSDKLQRLAHFVGGQEMKVSDESLRDTLLDIVNYTVLVGAYIESKKEN